MKYVNDTKRCFFEANWIKNIDYKNISVLLKFVDYFWKIKKSYYSWTTRRNQAKLAKAIKRARHMALIQFTR